MKIVNQGYVFDVEKISVQKRFAPVQVFLNVLQGNYFQASGIEPKKTRRMAMVLLQYQKAEVNGRSFFLNFRQCLTEYREK